MEEGVIDDGDERFTQVMSLRRILDADHLGLLNMKEINTENPSVWMREIDDFMNYNSRFETPLGFENNINHYEKYSSLLLFSKREHFIFSRISKIVGIQRMISAKGLLQVISSGRIKFDDPELINFIGDIKSEPLIKEKLYINLFLYLTFNNSDKRRMIPRKKTCLQMPEVESTPHSNRQDKNDGNEEFNFMGRSRNPRKSLVHEEEVEPLFEHNVLSIMDEDDQKYLRRLWFSFDKKTRAALWLQPVDRNFSNIKRFLILQSIGRS